MPLQNSKKGTVLREEIFRVALDDVHVSTLKQTASNLPEFTQWVEPDERCLGESSPEILGALRLHSGCRVVHVPTYLNGLWSACRSMGSGKKAWVVEDCTDWTDRLSSFDSVVLCAGAGLFQSSIIRDEFPVSLVRGQSVELALGENTCENAMLCGKYVSPLPNENRALIGATHEFKEEPLDSTTVETELRSRSDPFASRLWSKGTVDKITSGYRVQSNRGKDGRLPIIGRFDTPIHSDTWVFTGLSSRGLLYHGVFGDALTDLMLNVEGDAEHQQLDWWRTKVIRR